MAVASTTAKFHKNFWGQENAGFEVLLQNMKAGVMASKELGDFIRERMATEDSYVKGLAKLHKFTSQISTASLGTFGPLWDVLKTMCEKLVEVHGKFVEMLGELSKEIGEYHHVQKEKLKQKLRGSVERAQESLGAYQSTEAAMNKTLKHYQQSVDHLAKTKGKLEKAKAEANTNPKAKLRISELEGRVTHETVQMDVMKNEHRGAVAKNCDHLMEFQGKMSEACKKFESVEEEHLAQMVTFMIKMARTQDTINVGVAEQYGTFNSQLDYFTVEKLLKDFVAAKGTGQDKPTPQKFKVIPVVVPSLTSSVLAGSTEDIAAAAAAGAGAGDRRSSKTVPKKSKKLFKKKGKHNVSGGSNGPVEQSLQVPAENAPEVDEEGYSIRPEDAASVPKFPDDPFNKKDSSDSDSDFDDEPENKIKTIKIRDTSTQPQASVDDIKASMMSLRLGTVSPLGMKKATSSQSLNILSANSATPPATSNRKMSAATSSQNIQNAVSPSQNAISLIDIDSILTTDTSTAAPSMPDPLLPAGPPSTKFQPSPSPLIPISVSPTIRRAHETSQIPSPLIPTAAISAPKSNPLNSSSQSSAVDVTASLPAWGSFPPVSATPPVSKPAFSTPVGAIASSGSGISTATTSPSLSSPIIPRPRAGSLKDIPSSVAATSSSELPVPAGLGSIPAPPLPSKRRSRNSIKTSDSSVSASPPPGGVSGPMLLSAVPTSVSSPSPLTQSLLLPTPVSPKQTPTADSAALSGSKSLDSSPTFGRKADSVAASNSAPSTSSTSGGNVGPSAFENGEKEEEAPPVPTPRSASLLRSPTKSSSTTPSPPHIHPTPLSPLATTQISAHALPTTTTAPAASSKVMPLAIAIHETCNAIFKGTSLSSSLVKVTGEVVISFPASFLPFLGTYEPLKFKVVGVALQDKVQRMLHNQHLIKKSEGDGEDFIFEKEALISHLKMMQEKASAPFYNIQILKYDVVVPDGSKLPLQLVAYMKCEPTVTNFRLDYTYQPGVFQSKPTLSKVMVTVPMDGGVTNALTKPTGKWSAETNHMTWTIGDIQPSDNPVATPLHAKFEVGSGPSTPSSAQASFTCEGDTLSGLSVQLDSSMYRVSLMKKKCSSGKYEVEPKTSN